MLDPDPEFVTVAEAARALGLSERQVRRYTSQLQPTDKRQDSKRQHKGQPVGLVRLLSVESLLKSDLRRGESTGIANGHASGVPVEPTGKPTDTPVGSVPVELAEALQRAAVAEARAELLEKSVTNVQAERDAWKEQTGSLTEALRAAQDEARAARVIGNREIRQVESSETLSEDPKQTRAWWPFARKRKV